MNLKRLFGGLVITVAVLFAGIYAALDSYLLAIVSLGVGGLWLTLDAKIANYEGTLFFLAFVALAVIASLDDTLKPWPLLGLSINLAAWDIARFTARLANAEQPATRAVLTTRHLILLAGIIILGFVFAVLPALVRLAIPFVIVGGVALLALLTLQQSMRSLSRD
ncbi:MAG: hypothetical protein JXA10_08230 [Anaerolineae bacterium]|nr:hypothetical protein [Anaerolineae bacterium]